jgi:hypothetical protein
MSAYDADPAQATIRVTDGRPLPNDIARGPAGDCCILCGKVAGSLPLDHGCKPNIEVQAYRAELANALTNSGRGAA